MRTLPSLSDTELIDELRKGHERAFDVLLLRYKADVRNVIVHFVKDRTITEDLSQEAFIRIYTSLKRGRYTDEGKFVPWALRIARNLCMDHLRKAAQFPPASSMVRYDCADVLEHRNAESELILKEQQHRLNTFINRLPADQKKVVCYRYFEELSFKEIAALMNTSVNTSLGRMRYGLDHLRRQVRNAPAFAWR